MSKKMPHSKFPLTNTNTLTTRFGWLTPFYFQRTVPGDRLSLKSTFDIQLMPLNAPMFQDCRVYVHYYYVPERVLHVDEDYNAFLSREQRSLATRPHPINFKSYTTIGDLLRARNRVFSNSGSGSVVPPVMDGSVFDGLLPDYLRIQLGEASTYNSSSGKITIETLLSYFKIWLDHFASTEYPAFIPFSSNADGSLNYRELPYEDLLYIYSWFQLNGYDTYISSDSVLTPPAEGIAVYALDFLLAVGEVMYGRTGDMFMSMYPTSEAAATSQAIGSTIESLRVANAMQKYNERKARVGHGVADFLWEFFHVKNSDARLQRSVYLGGGRMPLNVDDVLQTSMDTEDSALGQLAGNAWRNGGFGFGRRYFEEFGYVYGLVYIVPKQAYFQGIDKLNQQIYADDQYNEAFDALGDEAVTAGELYFAGNTNDDDTIGYQPRFNRYKYVKNEIHGDFKSSLLYWHQSRKFSSRPGAANIRIVHAKEQGLNRIFNTAALANPTTPQPICINIRNKAIWRRKMRFRSVPHL